MNSRASGKLEKIALTVSGSGRGAGPVSQFIARADARCQSHQYRRRRYDRCGVVEQSDEFNTTPNQSNTFDAPEYNQAFGGASSKHLNQLVLGKEVNLDCSGGYPTTG
jgi:hypothetical protein